MHSYAQRQSSGVSLADGVTLMARAPTATVTTLTATAAAVHSATRARRRVIVVPPALAVVTFTSGAVRPTPRVIRGMVDEESELC